jgi:sigma-E factor negative regulatory protein RseC
MIEELATVIKVERDQVWVNPQISSGCGACMQKTSCTSSIVGRFFKPRIIEVDSSFPLVVGDKVMVTIDESLLLNASLLLYLFPLLAMFMGAGIAEAVLNEAQNADTYIAAAGLGSLFLALGLLHLVQKNWLSDYCVKAVVVKKF